MKSKANQLYRRTLRRISASILFVLRYSRLSVIYVALAVILVVAWMVSLLGGSPAAAHTPTNSQTAAPQQTTLESESESLGGDTPTMQSKTQDTSNSNSSQTSVNADDSGTTVTVNGNTQTSPPNQSFVQTYDASNNGATSHVDVSVDNNTNQSGRSVNMHLHSSTHSSQSSSSSSSNP
jgi:hypothetical protein